MSKLFIPGSLAGAAALLPMTQAGTAACLRECAGIPTPDRTFGCERSVVSRTAGSMQIAIEPLDVGSGQQRFSVTPPLPPGLTPNPSSGVIAGLMT